MNAALPTPRPIATAHRRYLHRLLSRARRPRWHRQARRRRPWLVRPLTAGEQNLLTYRLLAQELATLLGPFRRTRPRGHFELDGLLRDADTRPAVLAQVRTLQDGLARANAEYVRQDLNLTRWRQEWGQGTAAQRRLTEQEKALAINEYHGGLFLLLAEAQADVKRLEALCPEAFTPAPLPAPAATPPPYSA